MNDLSINTYEFYTVSKTGILRKICMRNTKKKKKFCKKYFHLVVVVGPTRYCFVTNYITINSLLCL